jgi:hypothetical protein
MEQPHEMTATESLTALLRENFGLYYCDCCLNAEASTGRRRGSRKLMQELLANTGVFDGGTTCDRCDRNRRSIAFIPRVFVSFRVRAPQFSFVNSPNSRVVQSRGNNKPRIAARGNDDESISIT